MWLASEMTAFAHVCELKSFTAAARTLGVPKVAVSRAIVSLERRLGTRLLNRTTRRVGLTPAGELLLPHCQRVLAEVEAVRGRFAALGPEALRLRLRVDPGYGRLVVTPLVPRFMERFGNVQLTVAVMDSRPEEPSNDWDLLICNGASLPPPQPGFSRTPLGSPPLLLCATPAYFAQHGRPKKPTDLLTHTVMRPGDHAVSLQLQHAGQTQELRLRPALQVDDPALVHSSAAAGLGIAVLPEFLCRQGLALGKLERVLPEWSVREPLELVALYAAGREESAAIRQFLEFLMANLVPVLGGSDRTAGKG
jgi:DNA-binding transcriptional LysR family regulator